MKHAGYITVGLLGLMVGIALPQGCSNLAPDRFWEFSDSCSTNQLRWAAVIKDNNRDSSFFYEGKCHAYLEMVHVEHSKH